MSNHPNRSKNNPPEFRSPKPAELVAARERVGLTQTEAANLLSVTLSAWQRWEQGEREMQSSFFEMFQRLVEERPALLLLGAPDHPLQKFDMHLGVNVVMGLGWLIGAANDGTDEVEILLAPSGAVGVEVRHRSNPNSVVAAGRWGATAGFPIRWLVTEHNSFSAKTALTQAVRRYYLAIPQLSVSRFYDPIDEEAMGHAYMVEVWRRIRTRPGSKVSPRERVYIASEPRPGRFAKGGLIRFIDEEPVSEEAFRTAIEAVGSTIDEVNREIRRHERG